MRSGWQPTVLAQELVVSAVYKKKAMIHKKRDGEDRGLGMIQARPPPRNNEEKHKRDERLTDYSRKVFLANKKRTEVQKDKRIREENTTMSLNESDGGERFEISQDSGVISVPPSPAVEDGPFDEKETSSHSSLSDEEGKMLQGPENLVENEEIEVSMSEHPDPQISEGTVTLYPRFVSDLAPARSNRFKVRKPLEYVSKGLFTEYHILTDVFMQGRKVTSKATSLARECLARLCTALKPMPYPDDSKIFAVQSCQASPELREVLRRALLPLGWLECEPCEFSWNLYWSWNQPLVDFNKLFLPQKVMY